MKAPIAGGDVNEIAPIDGSLRGATWQSDGSIVYATTNVKTGIMSVASAGGLHPNFPCAPRARLWLPT